MDGDQIVVEVQETVFVSDVVDSDITVHNFVPDDPDSVVIQDVWTQTWLKRFLWLIALSQMMFWLQT